MRNKLPHIVTGLLVLIITLTACNRFLVGNGQTKIKSRKVDPFHAIVTEGSFTIYLTQAASEGLQIETDGNLHSRIKSKVIDDVLYLKMDDKTSQPSFVKAYVNYNKLDNITLDNHSELHAKTLVSFDNIQIQSKEHAIVDLYLETDTLQIKASGTSKYQLKGDATHANFKLNGKSQLHAFALKTDTCQIKSSEFSKAEIFVMKQLNSQQKGMSEVTFRGKVKDENIKFTTQGNSKFKKYEKKPDEI